MCGMVHIGTKILSIQKATEKLNDISSDVSEFSVAVNFFNLDLPSIAAIISSDCCKGSIREPTQNLVKQRRRTRAASCGVLLLKIKAEAI